MGDSNLIVIIAIEMVALCLFFIGLLLIKNRKLKSLIQKLQNRMEELVKQLKLAKSLTAEPPKAPATKPVTYSQLLSKQLENTIEHHGTLGTRQDIALDLDPDAPLPRRAAAFRHAVLIAEKEACAAGDSKINWDVLNTRYQQLLSYQLDYEPAPKAASGELDDIKAELHNAKKRINNLERFKVMYFDLEAKWEKCKGEANAHYSELKTIASKTENPEDFDQLLDDYHAAYNDIGSLIEIGADESGSPEPDDDPESHLVEIKRLRSVAEDQHRIITELQSKLKGAPDSEAQIQVVEELNTELKKQSQFLQESETCIRLMEEELRTAQEELDSLRSRTKDLPKLKALAKELQSNADINEQIVGSLKQENRRLAKKLKVAMEAPPEENKETATLRKELLAMQTKYNDLEEKYLDLKLRE